MKGAIPVSYACPRWMLQRAPLALLLLAAPFFGQQQATQAPEILDGGLYRAPRVSPYSFTDSQRADALIRAGQLYLSLADAISIALENNLDIAIQRYDPPIANTDLLRAKGGGEVRGVPLVVSELPQSVITPLTPLVNAAAGGVTTSSTVSSTVPDIYPVTGALTTLAINGGTSTTSVGFAAGPPIPGYDPSLTGSLMWQHSTTPETDTALTGTNTLDPERSQRNARICPGLQSGHAAQRELQRGLPEHQFGAQHLRSVFDLQPRADGHTAASARVRAGGEPALYSHRQNRPAHFRLRLQ